jgi:hypothetical protein
MNFMLQRFNTMSVQFLFEMIARRNASVCYCNFRFSAEAITLPHKSCQKVTHNYCDRYSTPAVRVIIWLCIIALISLLIDDSTK